MDRVTELAARWQAAEQQLYPSLLFDEERYEQAMLVVRAAVEELGACATEADLVAAHDDREAVVARAARRAEVDLAGLDPHQLAAAALRLRLGAIKDEQRRRDAAGAITEARARGGGWATVYQRGLDSPPHPPYERLSVYLPSPDASGPLQGLHRWVHLDVDTDAPRYGVAVVQVELDGDVPAAVSEPLTGPEAHDTAGSWEEAIDRFEEEVTAAANPDRVDKGR